ncbi:MAG: hypothetical protein U0807_08605 [Candidatus Binatia bacterium]
MAVATIGIVILPRVVIGYNDDAHRHMSLTTVERSVLATDPRVLADLGLPPWEDKATGRQSRNLIGNAVARGGYYEDRGINSRSHFLNPLTGEGFTHRGGGAPSPVFALEAIRDAGGTWADCDGLQLYSLHDARLDFLTVLTVESRLTRANFWQKTWEDLGAGSAAPYNDIAHDAMSRAAAENSVSANDDSSPLQAVNISARFAEYAVTRTIAGESRLFLIDFIRDADGVWRIASM